MVNRSLNTFLSFYFCLVLTQTEARPNRIGEISRIDDKTQPLDNKLLGEISTSLDQVQNQYTAARQTLKKIPRIGEIGEVTRTGDSRQLLEDYLKQYGSAADSRVIAELLKRESSGTNPAARRAQVHRQEQLGGGTARPHAEINDLTPITDDEDETDGSGKVPESDEEYTAEQLDDNTYELDDNTYNDLTYKGDYEYKPSALDPDIVVTAKVHAKKIVLTDPQEPNTVEAKQSILGLTDISLKMLETVEAARSDEPPISMKLLLAIIGVTAVSFIIGALVVIVRRSQMQAPRESGENVGLTRLGL